MLGQAKVIFNVNFKTLSILIKSVFVGEWTLFTHCMFHKGIRNLYFYLVRRSQFEKHAKHYGNEMYLCKCEALYYNVNNDS
jgi:hypothetical protein